MLATEYSPLTGFARRLPWARSPGRQRLVTFAAFALPPTLVFWAWFVLQGRHGIAEGYRNLTIAMPITSLWITIGPMLMQQGEFGLERLLMALNARAEAGSWNLPGVQRAIRRADRHYVRVTFPLTVAAIVAVWLGDRAISSVVAIRGPAAHLGLVVVSCVGFASASGVWGCVKALSVVRAATRGAASEWFPFRPEQPSGIGALYEFCWSTALIFSSGSVSLPMLLVVQARLPAVTRVIVLAFVALLGLGGLVLFTVPIRWLRALGRAQKDRILDALAEPIEWSQHVLLHPDRYSSVELRRSGHLLDMALKLRAEVDALNPVPLPTLVSRGAATLVLPLLLTVLQLAVTSML